MICSRKILLGVVVLSGMSSVLATAADLRVVGSVVRGACVPSFDGGGVLGYGAIPIATLNPTSRTEIGAKSISYTIACDAPFAIGTSWLDGRINSDGSDNMFGLGQQGAVFIGDYRIVHSATGATASGAPVDVIVSDDRGATWAALGAGEQLSDNSRFQSYSTPGSLLPVASSLFTGTLEVHARINPTRSFDLDQPIRLDGLATMTVNYL